VAGRRFPVPEGARLEGAGKRGQVPGVLRGRAAALRVLHGIFRYFG